MQKRTAGKMADGMNERLKAESRRLTSGPSSSERPSGVGTVRFAVRCPSGARGVLLRATEVLRAVVTHSDKWPSEDEWKAILPTWFVATCAAPITIEQANQ
jgi:hypothetical protein